MKSLKEARQYKTEWQQAYDDYENEQEWKRIVDSYNELGQLLDDIEQAKKRARKLALQYEPHKK